MPNPEPKYEKPPSESQDNAQPLVWPKTFEYLEFEKLPVAKPKPLINNLLDRGSRILFGGGSKTFKTWIQCDLAVSLSAGAPWLGFTTQRVRVLYVNLELKEYYMQRRLSEIRKARDITLEESSLFVWNLRGLAFNRAQFAVELLIRCQSLGIAIVFIDPFYKLLSHLEDENSQTHMGAVLRSFDDINKADITTAFGIHFSKGNQAFKEPEDRISGAGTISRDADNIVTLTKHEEALAFTLDFISRDHPPLDSFVVKWESPVMNRTDLDPEKIKKPLGRHPVYNPDDLLEFIKENDLQFSTNELKIKVLEELGWKERTFYEKFSVLKCQKLISLSKVTGKWGVKLRK